MRTTTKNRVLSSTSNSEITSLSDSHAMSVYLASLRARSLPVDKSAIDQLSPLDIKKQLTIYRDSLITTSNNAKSAAPPSDTPNGENTHDTPSSSEPTSTTTHSDKVNDVNNYTSTVKDTPSAGSSIPPINKESNPAKTISQHFISIRTKWYREHFNKPHIELVREMVRIVRECDPQMYLVPSAKNSQLKIFHEDSLHTDNIYDYIWNNQTNDKTMKQFTLQFYIKVGTKVISTKIIDYMAKTKNYGKVDHLHSEKIACIGFFHNFHPEHNHRERLRQHCVEYIKQNHNTDVQLAIFPRQISAGKGLAKTATRVVVCEVSEDHAQLVSNALMACTFDQYTDVKFIPVTKFDNSYTEMLCKIIDAHRKFLHDIEIVRIPKMYLTHDKLEWKTNSYSTVRDLILGCNGTEAAFLHDVDVGARFSVNIMYYIDQENKMPPFLANLQQLLCDNIEFQALQLMYHYQGSVPALFNKRRVSKFEREYIAQLKDEFDVPNPRESQSPKAQKSRTNAWTKTPAPTSADNSKMQAMSDKIQSLEDALNKLSSVRTPPPNSSISQPDINSLIDTKVNTAMTSIQNEFDPKLQKLTSQVGALETSVSAVTASTTKLQTSITKLEATQTKLETTNSRLLAFLEKNYNLPASVPNDDPPARIIKCLISSKRWVNYSKV